MGDKEKSGKICPQPNCKSYMIKKTHRTGAWGTVKVKVWECPNCGYREEVSENHGWRF